MCNKRRTIQKAKNTQARMILRSWPQSSGVWFILIISCLKGLHHCHNKPSEFSSTNSRPRPVFERARGLGATEGSRMILTALVLESLSRVRSAGFNNGSPRSIDTRTPYLEPCWNSLYLERVEFVIVIMSRLELPILFLFLTAKINICFQIGFCNTLYFLLESVTRPLRPPRGLSWRPRLARQQQTRPQQQIFALESTWDLKPTFDFESNFQTARISQFLFSKWPIRS